MLFLEQFPLAVAISVFTVAAGLVWFSGARLSRYAAALSDHTGIDQTVIGVLLVAGITSLPELAVSVSAARISGADMAVGNLLGSVAWQAALLALADALSGREALTSVIVKPVILLLGILNIILLAIVAAAAMVPAEMFFGISYWSWVIAVAYPAGIILVARHGPRETWTAKSVKDSADRQPSAALPDSSILAIAWRIFAAAAVILGAGFILAQSGDAIAEKSGLGGSFFGVVFLALATSLPEISTVTTSVRLRRYELAVSDILGTNLFNIMLLVVIDLVLPGQAALSTAGTFGSFGALLGLVITAIFMGGLIERRNQTILHMGYDSLAVIIVYIGGIVVLYQLRT